MAIHYLLFLALIQGLTEFLPVSSSGHLVLVHHFFGEGSIDLCWSTNRMLDVAVHIGTLLAVVTYFYKDIWQMMSQIHKPNSDGFKLSKNVVIASIPVIIIGFIVQKIEPSFICMLEVMAWTMIIFGIVLWIADKYGNTDKKLKKMNVIQAFLIGLAQAIALIPGTSRSGITMTAARFLGYNRIDAAHFSLLLSIVAIAGAGTLNAYSAYKMEDFNLGMPIIFAISISFITGLFSIAAMMKWLEKFSFTPFVIYRIILGITLLYFIYSDTF